MRSTNIENEQWKEYMNEYQQSRKLMQYEYGVPKKISHEVIKNKDAEYNPLLSKFNDNLRENRTLEAIKQPLDVKKAQKAVITDKYMQPHDLITLERNSNIPISDEQSGRRKLLPKAQIDYNILTNNELNAISWQGYADKPDLKKVFSIHKKLILTKNFRNTRKTSI